MQIKVHTKVAEVIYEMIKDGKYQSKSDFNHILDQLEDSESMQLMLNFYQVSFESYKKVLFHALNNLDYKAEHDFYNQQYCHLKRIISSQEKVAQKIESIKTYDFFQLEKRLLEKLPEDTHFDIHIHFVFDGINGGSIVGDQKMMINTMFWPSEEKNLHLFEGILLHEYHHLGLQQWMQKKHVDLNHYSSGRSVADSLIISIMAEGAATYFYNDGDDLYPLAVESHGIEMANAYRESMQERGHKIESYIRQLEQDLQSMINEEQDISNLIELKNTYSFSSTEPLDKSIGYHMCQSIDQTFGLPALIACFKDSHLFLKTYNKSLNQDNTLRIKKDITTLLN